VTILAEFSAVMGDGSGVCRAEAWAIWTGLTSWGAAIAGAEDLPKIATEINTKLKKVTMVRLMRTSRIAVKNFIKKIGRNIVGLIIPWLLTPIGH
jgi:hypothetical protein